MPQANSGPLPPKANSANSRGSRPRSLDTALMARIMLEAAISCAPKAAASRLMPQAVGDGGLEDGTRLVGIESERAADEMPGIDEAEDDIGVGQRRHRAAHVVAHRPRRRAGALGPYLQRAARIDPDMRAPAGTDLGQVDGRDLQRIARARQQSRPDHDAGADRVFLRAHHLAVLDHGGFRGRAAHVEGDDPVETSCRAPAPGRR